MDAKPNPKAVQLKNLLTEYRQIGSLLGFDPVSRARMSVDPDEKNKGKFSGLINGPAKKQQKS